MTPPTETQPLPQETKLSNMIDEKLGDGLNQIKDDLVKLISSKLETTELTSDKQCIIICGSS